MIDALTRLPLRIAMRALYRLMKLRWFVARPGTRGAHAIALTPEGRIILVRLRYVGGWRAPGGGIGPGEDAESAALRELREEIGLVSHGPVRFGLQCEQRIHFREDVSAVFIVPDVRYRPRWSWEVEAVMEASLDALPTDLSPRTRSWIERAGPLLSPAGIAGTGR